MYFDINYICYQCQTATGMINMFSTCKIMGCLVLDIFNLYDNFYILVVIVTK